MTLPKPSPSRSMAAAVALAFLLDQMKLGLFGLLKNDVRRKPGGVQVPRRARMVNIPLTRPLDCSGASDPELKI